MTTDRANRRTVKVIIGDMGRLTSGQFDEASGHTGVESFTTAGRSTGAGRIDLVDRAAHGDIGAFEQLVDSGSDSMLRVARAILGNDADARDAVQDAYVAAWRALPGLRDHASFEGWLRRIVVNACRSGLRNRRRVYEISLDDRVVDQPDPGPTTSDTVADTDMLSRAFERLDANKRAILVLHYLEHRSVAAIAATLGIAPGTVKWRLSDARAALARALTAEGEERR
jgi:RNA polymerase sigma-70 factor (ECF subfamily)